MTASIEQGILAGIQTRRRRAREQEYYAKFPGAHASLSLLAYKAYAAKQYRRRQEFSCLTAKSLTLYVAAAQAPQTSRYIGCNKNQPFKIIHRREAKCVFQKKNYTLSAKKRLKSLK